MGRMWRKRALRRFETPKSAVMDNGYYAWTIKIHSNCRRRRGACSRPQLGANPLMLHGNMKKDSKLLFWPASNAERELTTAGSALAGPPILIGQNEELISVVIIQSGCDRKARLGDRDRVGGIVAGHRYSIIHDEEPEIAGPEPFSVDDPFDAISRIGGLQIDEIAADDAELCGRAGADLLGRRRLPATPLQLGRQKREPHLGCAVDQVRTVVVSSGMEPPCRRLAACETRRSGQWKWKVCSKSRQSVSMSKGGGGSFSEVIMPTATSARALLS